jgi:RNA polymerase sigma-70 factor (ECF subfamily)
MPAATFERLMREDYGKVLAVLARRCGDLDLAEDVLAEALARAAERWPREGEPAQPAAWLTTVARNLLIDRARSHPHEVEWAESAAEEAEQVAADTAPEEPAVAVADDRLRLLFVCCHPSLNQESRMALALRTLCGLTTREIARAFVQDESTIAQRLVRAKRKIREARIPFEVPGAADLPERIDTVLAVIYLLFNEGYLAHETEPPVRTDLCEQAIRLGKLACDLVHRHVEAQALVALMLLQHARRAARVRDGALVPLEEQDRRLWNAGDLRAGLAWLDDAIACHRQARTPPRPYLLQAAIAALHGRAPSAAATDWPQIAALYDGLLAVLPSPVVALNGAVAHAMVQGPQEGLRRIAELDALGELAGYHLLPAAQAELLRRAGDRAGARAAYRRALALATQPLERRYLERRLCELGGDSGA